MAVFPRYSAIGRTLRMPLRALLYRRPSEPPAISITFDREIYLVRVRRHRQARRYTLRIHSGTREVVLTMPPLGSLTQAREFAQKHGAWIAAVALYCVATLACALSTSIEMLIVARAVQALGGSGGIVLVRAIVRDLYSGARAGRELSLIG